MVWPSFAEKESEREFETALSEDLFDRPCLGELAVKFGSALLRLEAFHRS
jgi:hypothetical protein